MNRRWRKRVKTGVLRWEEPLTAFELMTGKTPGHRGTLTIDLIADDKIRQRRFLPRVNFTSGQAEAAY